jgi:methylmalonyl-CoA mutase N-terminal domain/subunit
MWATMLKERFGARNPRSMMVRQIATAHIGYSSTSLQRPLNNLSRSVVGAMAAGMSGGVPLATPPYDEPLGLGHSLEAQQLAHDTTRILIYEAKICEVSDPWAGSYFMESLTDELEEAAMIEIEKIDKMGGAVAAVENGYMHQAAARSAYDKQRKYDDLEEFMVGVNCFTGEHELEVTTNRSVSEVYDEDLKASAEERQKAALAQIKRDRDNKEVSKTLKALEIHAKNESENLMPYFIDCVKSYATLQEMCDVLRGLYGDAEPAKI